MSGMRDRIKLVRSRIRLMHAGLGDTDACNEGARVRQCHEATSLSVLRTPIAIFLSEKRLPQALTKSKDADAGANHARGVGAGLAMRLIAGTNKHFANTSSLAFATTSKSCSRRSHRHSADIARQVWRWSRPAPLRTKPKA
jgi:hypothetical protein